MFTIDEWLWGDNVGGARSYIIHTSVPRFICRIGDDDQVHPPFEYELADEEGLFDFIWIDPPPEDLTVLLTEAEQFVYKYNVSIGIKD